MLRWVQGLREVGAGAVMGLAHGWTGVGVCGLHIIIIIIEGLSLLQSIPPTTADKQTQAQKRRGSRSRKLLGAKAKSYRLKN